MRLLYSAVEIVVQRLVIYHHMVADMKNFRWPAVLSRTSSTQLPDQLGTENEGDGTTFSFNCITFSTLRTQHVDVSVS
jgi:hypothetical protein